MNMLISEDVLRKALANIYRKMFNVKTEIEPYLYDAIREVFNQATNDAFPSVDRDEDFKQQLKHSNEVFSAFKVHRAQNDMAVRLLDSNGGLKPFNQWLKDVLPIASHQCGAWLRTEYDTAVLRAHQAADWQQFRRERDVLPNLKWMPSTSLHPGEDHRKYWGTIRPIDDEFWTEHRPGDRWNCKCSLTSTDEAVTPVPAEDVHSEPQAGLKGNPGTTGETFSDDHPYFPASCSDCPFYNPKFKDRLKRLFRDRGKDCYHCPYIDSKLNKADAVDVKPPKVETYKDAYKGQVFTSPYHGKNEVEENERLAKFVSDKLKTKVYLLPRLDPMNPTQKALRAKLLPSDVFEGKNPDFLIGGKLFDGKSMLSMNRNATIKQQKNAIENHIKKAKKQADNIILEIPSSVARTTIHSTITNYLSRSKKERTIMIHWKNKLIIYK